MKIKKVTFKSLITLLFGIIPFLVNSQDYPSFQEIENAIKKEVDNGRSTSIVVGIIDNGKEHFISYGNLKEGPSQKVNEKTIYEIASTTKVFVNTIFADLILKGQLTLDDPIIKYLPDTLIFQDKRINKITLKQLATHTSGLPNLIDKFDMRELDSYYKNQTIAKLFLSLEKCNLIHDTGKKFNYSNINMSLLAYAICKVTNKDLESLLKDKILEPFKMDNTCFNLNKEQEQYFAAAYKRPGRLVNHWEWNAQAGAGGLRSTAQDLITFLRKLFYEDSPLKKAADYAIKVQFDSTRFQNTKIGLGWFITENKNSLLVGHGGTSNGFQSVITYDKINNRGVVVLSNSSRSISDIGFYLFDKKNKIKEFESIKSQELKTDLYTKFEGSYSISYKNILDTLTIYKKDDFYFVYSEKIGESEMFYQGDNTFLIDNKNMKIEFSDIDSKKSQTIIFNDGKEIFKGKRILLITK